MAALNPKSAANSAMNLILAATKGDLDGVKAALVAGAAIDSLIPSSGMTAMHHAVVNNDLEMTRFLVQSGANMEIGDLQGNTPLHKATEHGFDEIFEFLLASGADYVPLHTAVGHYRGGYVMALLDAGADTTVEGNSEYGTVTPEELAGDIFNGRTGQAQLWAEETAEIFRRYREAGENALPPRFKREGLFSGARGEAPLFYQPRVWHQFDAVAASVAVSDGRPFSKADLLQEDKSGLPWLARAVECQALVPVMRYLHQRGEMLTPQDLLTEKGEPNALLRTIVRKQALPVLMNKENWHSQGVGAFKRVVYSLPVSARSQLTNLHGLLTDIDRASIKTGAQR